MRVGGAFGDSARASADEAMDVSAALGALRDGGVRHLLALLEAACAGITLVIVGGHDFLSLGLIVKKRAPACHLPAFPRPKGGTWGTLDLAKQCLPVCR